MSKASLFTVLFVSLVVPALVALMYYVEPNITFLSEETLKAIPSINAVINSLTAVLMVVALMFIKQGKVGLHKISMLSAMGLGLVFLLLYVLYHSGVPGTKYPEDAPMRGLYLFILLSHILLAGIVLPFVLLTFFRAYFGDFESHKKIAKYTLPIWFYVSVSGVIVYLMISPYYV